MDSQHVCTEKLSSDNVLSPVNEEARALSREAESLALPDEADPGEGPSTVGRPNPNFTTYFVSNCQLLE